MKKGIGIIGCGNISGIYLKNLTAMFSNTKVVAVADLDIERAQRAAGEYQIDKACSVSELLNCADVDIVVNLTIPAAHAEVSLAALAAGKHTYAEKPMALAVSDAKRVLEKARMMNCLYGGAPDTFMGAGYQTARKLIDDKWIGDIVGFNAFMMCRGHESWHPAPEFYYKPGGGPMFDMGPYYLTALVALLGSVKTVSAMTKTSFAKRVITSQPQYGKVIDVEVSTHVCGLLEFANGASGSITTSFDVAGAQLPFIEIYGSEGSLSLPDPNCFGGPVRIKRRGGDWCDAPMIFEYDNNSRGIGVADMAALISKRCATADWEQDMRQLRASGLLTTHVLEIMAAMDESQRRRGCVDIDSQTAKPLPLIPNRTY